MRTEIYSKKEIIIEMEETRVAIIGIIISDMACVEAINMLLHESNQYIVGRMGIPYRAKDISVICVVLDAPQDVISTLSGKLGRLSGANCKVTYSNR
jgi:putative iron-only hydrogenase system regulator